MTRVRRSTNACAIASDAGFVVKGDPDADIARHNIRILQCEENHRMPEQETIRRAKRDLNQGKAPSTAAGEFVHEEIEHVREGKHGARSSQQAIAIGLSKARRAGVPLPPPKKGRVKESTRKSAEREYKAGQRKEEHSPSPRASRARERVLEQEPHAGASHRSLSRQARNSSRERGAENRHRSAMKAVKTKGKSGLRQAGKKAGAHPCVAS